MMDLEKLLKRFDSISDYKIITKGVESSEMFYVHKTIETIRTTNTASIYVTIYVKNDNFLGEATFEVYDYQTEEELKKVINDNVFRASLIKNQYYEIPSDNNPIKHNKTNIENYSLNDVTKKIAKALSEVEMEEHASLNATEIFVYKKDISIVNSKGINKSDTTYSIMIETIPTWTENNESVELYEQYNTSEINEENIKSEIKECLDNVWARYKAIKPDYIIEAPVLIHILDAEEIYSEIVSQLNYRMVYTDSNYYKLNDLIQSNPKNDKLNISLEAFINGSSENRSFDGDGITLSNIELVKDSKVINYYGDCRFAYYLDKKPTGSIPNIYVKNGNKSVEELKNGAYLECISFSGLQVDVYNDYIGGEVRLAKYYDGNKIVSITGISISGKLSDVLNTLELSSEYEVKNNIKAPKLIKLSNMNIF